MRTLLLCAVSSIVLACGGKGGDQETIPDEPVAADEPTAADPAATPPAGAPDPALLAKGADVFSESCSTCHGDDGMGQGKSPAVRGPGALSRFASDDELLAYTREEMPKDDPGGLSDEEYQAVVVWMRSE